MMGDKSSREVSPKVGNSCWELTGTVGTAARAGQARPRAKARDAVFDFITML